MLPVILVDELLRLNGIGVKLAESVFSSARGAALNSYDKREIRGIEPGGAHHRTTEYHEPELEWGESPHHPRRKLTRQA